jgi:outer membrane protein OmpA-like peptidoglycan-associated protein
MLLRDRTWPEFAQTTSCLKTGDSAAAHAPTPRIPRIRIVYAGGISMPAVACALLLLPSLVPSPSQAEFDPPRVASKVSDSHNPEQLRYYMDSGVEAGIERGDVLNVYREKSLIRNEPHPIRLLIGRMTITESQPGLSEGIFEVSAATISHPLIRCKSAMKGDIVAPRIVIDSTLMFGAGLASLTRQAADEFQKVADFVQDFAPSKIIIEGHTDSDGDPETNMLLSESRAKTVRDFLVARYSFISSAMVDIRGYGSARPIVPNDSPENKQLNRRIEVIVWN